MLLQHIQSKSPLISLFRINVCNNSLRCQFKCLYHSIFIRNLFCQFRKCIFIQIFSCTDIISQKFREHDILIQPCPDSFLSDLRHIFSGCLFILFQLMEQKNANDECCQNSNQSNNTTIQQCNLIFLYSSLSFFILLFLCYFFSVTDTSAYQHRIFGLYLSVPVPLTVLTGVHPSLPSSSFFYNY